ncbi:MAG: hypothetical protein H6605_08605 [Flavobacteriales bacterium]|nr:hypothetical protein [Flavobacteriales bacterium]
MTVSDASTVCQGDPSQVVHFSGSSATPPYTFTFNVDNIPISKLFRHTGNAYDTAFRQLLLQEPLLPPGLLLKDSSSSACSIQHAGRYPKHCH